MLVLELWSINLYRVRTDLWIQHSRLKKIDLFFQTQVYQIGDQQRPLKKQSKAFFMIHCKHTRPRLNKISTKQKKIIHNAIKCCSLGKNQDFLPFFQSLSLLANFKTFSKLFQEFKTPYEPCLYQVRKRKQKNCMFVFLTFSRCSIMNSFSYDP